MQYLGDVLLTTPLFHSLRMAYPNAQLDVLVYSNTASILEGNQDINHIITTANRPKTADYIKLGQQIIRRYDLAVVTQTGDRPFLYGLLAAKMRVSVVPQKINKGWWKRFFVQRWIEFDNINTHTVLQHLKLLDLINVKSSYSVVAPQIKDSQSLEQQFNFLVDNVNFAVLHTHPQWTYKQWTVEGWLQVGRYLNGLGLKLVLSGGPFNDEINYVKNIQNQLPKDTINLAGKLSLAQLTYILSKAKLYIGPDTGITHLAAATGIPVIALYGPTNPVKWAPWPFGYAQNTNPFNKIGSQHVNNISFIQGKGECVPCYLEGCQKHQQSRSQCLDTLLSEEVKSAVNQMLKLL